MSPHVPNPFSEITQKIMYADHYAQWRPQDGRREHWDETVERVMSWFDRALPHARKALGEPTWTDLSDAFYNLEVMPSMRVIQMAGPALDRCMVGAFNCAFTPIDSFRSFGELLYVLMQGTGIGFSVEKRYVSQMPAIQPYDASGDTIEHRVDDSTEGWVTALLAGLETWARGGTIRFDYSAIRAAGAPLRTKGGYASGPDPLRNLLEFAEQTFRKAGKAGRKLTTLECHDLACMTGYIVQVGGTRRAAMISLSDPDDLDLAYAKHGTGWFETHPFRTMANNSAAYEYGGDDDATITELDHFNKTFGEEFERLRLSGTGERGVFNTQAVIPSRRQRRHFGINPCGEILLRPREFCNLSQVVARPDDTADSLKRKIKFATIFGTLQSCCTKFAFPFEAPEWKQNCEEERLLGVDITGQFDCPALRPDAPNRKLLLRTLLSEARFVNRETAALLGIQPSAAITCIKPSGNSSQFLNASSGIHPRHSAFYFRRFRFGIHSAMSKFLIDSGMVAVPEGQNNVFTFPIKAPEGSPTRNDYSALDQLDNWLFWKQNYVEQAVSCTITVRPHEWTEVHQWVRHHWDQIVGLSFLPSSEHHYQNAPYEAITELQYETAKAEFPELDLNRLAQYETRDDRNLSLDFACTSGGCLLQ